VDNNEGWFTAIVEFDSAPIDPFVDQSILNVCYTARSDCGDSNLDLADSTQGTGTCSLRCIYTNSSYHSLFPDITDGSFHFPSCLFIRGDADEDGRLTMADAIFILKYLYVPDSPEPSCMDAADVNDDGVIQMDDAIDLLKYLYVPGSPHPPTPYPDCGEDPTTQDSLDCQHHRCTMFIRGDCNSDTVVDSVDVDSIEHYLDSEEDFADVNDDGDVNIDDAYYLRDFVKGVGPEPPPPYPDCGYDKTVDSLYSPNHACNLDAARSKGSQFQTMRRSDLILRPSFTKEETVAVSVFLRNSVGLSAFAYTIEYNASLIESGSVVPGRFITDNFDFFSAKPKDGKITVGNVISFTMDRELPPGEHHVADIVLEFVADHVGGIDLSLVDVELFDTEGNVLSCQTQGTTIDRPSCLRTPRAFALMQASPNPTTGETSIRYSLPNNGHVSLRVYNSAGQMVSTLVNEPQESGYYRVDWDGKDVMGARVASGVYFYRIEAGDHVATRKMVLVR
jgi:hypothetical protein